MNVNFDNVSESDIEAECDVTAVSGLSITADATTYSEASKLTVSFAGTESDGKRYQWSAEISATDKTGLPTTVDVTKTLINAAPTITSSDSASVPENQTTVLDVEATDDSDSEGAGLTYSLTGGADQGKFSIDPSTGALSFKAPPDFGAPSDTDADNVYKVQVTVADSAALTAVQDISVTVTEDVTAPTVEILNAPASLSDLTPFTITIQFSEDVTGFVLGDVTVTNGTASDFVAVDADTYTVAITPSGAGDVTIDVAAGVAEDLASNPNTAAEQVVVGNTIVSDTQALISGFMSERADLITLSQPDLVERLTRGGGDLGAPLGFFASGDFDNYTMGFATSLEQLDSSALDGIVTAAPGTGETGATRAPFDIWVDGQWAHADTGSTATNFLAGHFGADYLLDPDLLIGVMAELDWTSRSESMAGSSADGLGWLAGPYVVARLQRHLYFDASLQGGQSYNHVSPLGTYTDNFDTDRWLAKAQFTGDFDLGALDFSPILAASYFSETQNAYTDSLNNSIPAQTISRGSIDFGPRISYLVEGEGVDIAPSLGLIGNWAYNVEGAGATSSTFSGRLEAGLSLKLDSGARFKSRAFYDGIGDSDHNAYGASARLSVPLN